MVRENQTAVIARNEPWTGQAATEPYEAGWASEAVFFVRALSIAGPAATAWPGAAPSARVQMSADGMRWIDEGTAFALPAATDLDTCARVTRFGNWLRIVADLPAGCEMRALVTLHLK